MDFTPTLLNHLKAGCDGQPDNADLQFAYGGALQKTDDFESAIERFTLAIELEPKRIDALVHRAICHTELGHFSDANEDLMKADVLFADANEKESAELQPRFRLAWCELASKWAATDAAKADAAFRRLLPVVSDDEMLEAFYAFCHANESDYAIQFYESAKETGSVFTTEYSVLFARLLAGDGRFADAISVLKALDKKNPNDSATLLELGWIYFLSADKANAADVLRAAVKLTPDHPQGYCSLAWVLSAEDLTEADAQEALDFAERMVPLKGHPEDRKLKVLARCQLRLGKLDEAQKTISKAIKLATPDQLPILQSMLQQTQALTT